MMASGDNGSSAIFYRRFDNPTGQLLSESIVTSDEKMILIGIFPVPALITPKFIASNVHLKFRSPIVVDQKSDAVFYTTIPVEIAVYRQSKDEELLLDAFSLCKQQYTLYGSPEKGALCRYKEVDIHTERNKVMPTRYEEASVRIAIRNGIENVVKVNKVIIPMENVILDHTDDDAWVPGTVEMQLEQTFGKDIINVRLVDSKVKRSDKTSVAGKTDSLIFLMDSGY